MTENTNTQEHGTRPFTPSLFLTIHASDAGALIDYCTEVLGFVVAARHDDGDRVAHAELLWPEGTGGFMLGSYRKDGPWSRPPGSAGAYVVTADVDALYQRVLDHGAEIVMPLTDMDYGSREFAVRDPEGNLWSFGTYAGQPLPG